MKNALRQFARVLSDRRGSAAVEFAILGPVLISMLLGVLMIGTQMQNYNALRSIAYDVSRYTVIEYQKDNKLTADQINLVTANIAGRSPYNLSRDELSSTVVEQASGITGAKKFVLTLSYTPMDISGILPASPTLTETQSIIVAD